MLSWDRPLALLAILAIAPLIALMIRAVTRLRLRRDRFAESAPLERMAVTSNEPELLVRMAMIALALVLGILALAGPRWGAAGGSLRPGESPALAIALDVSQSMLANDLEGGRFALARSVMTEVVEGLSGWKIGLVAFADEAQVFCPMTSDTRALVTLAQRARPGSELRGGSNLETALKTSQALLGEPPGAILLLTDGEALAGDAQKAVPALQESGALLVAVGIGTERGGRIASGTDLFGQPIYRTYQGALVNSKLDERGLKALAGNAGGRYLNASTPGAAQQIIQLLNERWKGSQASEPGLSLAPAPILLALGLLIAEALFSARRRLAGLSFARILDATLKRSQHLLVLLALSQLAFTWPWEGALGLAATSYERGDFPAAVTQMERALQAKPDDPKLLYGLGCAMYQGGDYPGAALAFKKALDRLDPDSELRPWVHYNLGNALVRQSERAAEGAEGKAMLEAAAAEYEQTLEIDPEDADARHNLAVVKARLSEPREDAKPEPGAQGNSGAAGGVPDMPAPDQAEVEALLDALEHDERQRHAEAAQARPPDTPGDLMRQLLRQAPDPDSSDRKDW
jgi:Ca-activated chloride channel family protein